MFRSLSPPKRFFSLFIFFTGFMSSQALNSTELRDIVLRCKFERWNVSHQACAHLPYLDTGRVTDMSSLFKDEVSFNMDISRWNTSRVVNMRNLFFKAQNFNADISKWDTSSVTDMRGTFSAARTFNGNLSGWNTGSAKDMAEMFSDASAFNGDITAWDTRNVITMEWMFSFAANFNVNLGQWNTSAVRNMRYMFLNARSFNGDVSAWNTSSVTDMSFIFADAVTFNGNLSAWQTSAVVGMKSMFGGWLLDSGTTFNGDVSSWNTSSVIDMASMFEKARVFNADISKWDTAKVRDMNHMFYDATVFNADISKWNTASVTNMQGTFLRAKSFNADISSWQTGMVTNMIQIFSDASSFNADISGWDTSRLTEILYLFEGASSFNVALCNWDVSNVVRNHGENGADAFVPDDFRGSPKLSLCDVNECLSDINPCYANSDCINAADGFTCQCREGYRSPQEAVEVDLEHTSQHACDAGQAANLGTEHSSPEECALAAISNPKCTGNTIMWAPAYNYAWGCRCCSPAPNGTDQQPHPNWDKYSYEASLTCLEIDECALGTDNCDADATCNNTMGSFTCSCNTGFADWSEDQNGVSCEEDQCATGSHDCDGHAECMDNDGGFWCSCHDGYESVDGGVTCFEGVNECLEAGTQACAGVPNAVCENTIGSFVCSCSPGFEDWGVGEFETHCEEDQCATGSHSCDANAQCIDTNGSFVCACREGFVDWSNGEGTACDRDQCSDGGRTCDDSARCVDAAQGFECTCAAGWREAFVACNDLPGWTDSLGDDCQRHQAEGWCADNTYGPNWDSFFGVFSDYANAAGVDASQACCACGRAYDQPICVDVDECGVLDNCATEAVCSNTQGSFECTCNDGFEGHGVTCDRVTTPAPTPEENGLGDNNQPCSGYTNFRRCDESKCCAQGLECAQQNHFYAQCLLPGICQQLRYDILWDWSCAVLTPASN